jgi:hypothetical protein
VSMLHNRMAGQSRNMAAAMGTYHPAGTPDTPMVMPMDLITVHPHGVISYQPYTPVYMGSAGTPVPAIPEGVWGQVMPAGQVLG